MTLTIGATRPGARFPVDTGFSGFDDVTMLNQTTDMGC
jgi:hypothetical protein